LRRVWLLLADVVQRRHFWILAVALVVTVALALGIPRIQFKTGQDTIVSSSSQVYKDNLRYQEQFGGDPMIADFEGDVRRLLSPPNVDTLRSLEANLRKQVGVGAVISPLTVVQLTADQFSLQQELAVSALTRHQEQAAQDARAVAAAQGLPPEAQEQAAQQASDAVAADFARQRQADAARLASVGDLSLDNPAFIDFIIFDEKGDVRPELLSVFPDPQHALMVVRLAGNMSIDEQSKVAGQIVETVQATKFEGLSVLPSGPAVLIKEINDGMRDSMVQMAILATAIMVLVLSLLFPVRWRLLSLPVVLVGCVWAFGLMGFLALPLTMVTISGLPILIGLGVDFAIQFHSRFDEESRREPHPAVALRRSFLHLGPAITVAVLAATLGFLVLHISRVPMVRDFGSMLAVGTVILFLAIFFVLNALLFLHNGGRPGDPTEQWLGARFRVENVVQTLTRNTVGRVLPIVVVGLFIALVGLLVDSRIPVQTDPERFIPQDSRVLKDLYHIRDVAGSSSELGIFVEAKDVTSPEVLSWMAAFQDRMQKEHKELLRSNSLAVLMMMEADGTVPPADLRAQVLATTPPDILRSLMSGDRTRASVIFSIADNVSLQERKALIDSMKADLRLPPGVSAAPAGLSVVGVEAVNALSANRDLMAYAAMGAIVLGLFFTYRNPIKAVAPVLPIVLALGSSSVLLFFLGIELSPLTAVSGPLIIAMGTEFTLLLMSRYFEERGRGALPREAMQTATLRIGRAITVSGLTVMGGFAVLAFSNFPLLTDFGKVTALDMGLALLSTLIVLPPLLIWLDEGVGLVPAEERLGAAE
jgi:hydrophobe/amphiphile efflux-3 (HAE3) family protein